jgi:hypothetical protein
MRKVWIVTAGLVLVFAAAGLWATAHRPSPACQPVTSGDSVACSTIDGFPIGQFKSECAPASASCFDSQTTAALEVQDPDRPEIVRVRLYDLDYGRVCDPGILCAYSGGFTIYVFDLVDSSRQAVGITCPGPSGCLAMRPYTGRRS